MPRWFLAATLLFIVGALATDDPGCNQGASIPDDQFKAFYASLKKASFDAERMKICSDFCSTLNRGFSGNQTVDVLKTFAFSANMVAAANNMSRFILGVTCKEGLTILNTFSFSNDKLTALQAIVNTITDPLNNNTLISAFSFSSDKDAARKIIAGMVPRTCVFGSVLEKRVQFIIDVSGSMATQFVSEGRTYTRLSFVVQQLGTVISKQLSSEQQFNIFTFAAGVQAWRPGLVPVNSSNTISAIQFIGAARADGGTNIYSALERAFQDPNVVAINLLTDGVPTVGVTNIDQIVAAATKWSKARTPPVAINTINFLVGKGGESPSEIQKSRQMMEAIARGTNGIWRDLQ